MHKFILPVLLALLVLAPVSGAIAAAPAPDGSSVMAIDAPAVTTAPAAVNNPLPADVAASLGPGYGYQLFATPMQTGSLNIELDTTQLFSGAQLMIDALGSPYLLIAGLGLGVAVLGAIMGAVRKVRL